MTRLFLILSLLFALSGCSDSSSNDPTTNEPIQTGSTPDSTIKDPATSPTPDTNPKDTTTPNSGKVGCLTLGHHFSVTNLTGKEFCADTPLFSKEDDAITFTDSVNVEDGQKKEIRILRPNNKAANSLLSDDGELQIDYVFNTDTSKYQGNKLCFKTSDLNAGVEKYGISIDTLAKTFTFKDVRVQEIHDHACSIRTNNKNNNSTLFLNGTLKYE